MHVGPLERLLLRSASVQGKPIWATLSFVIGFKRTVHKSEFAGFEFHGRCVKRRERGNAGKTVEEYGIHACLCRRRPFGTTKRSVHSKSPCTSNARMAVGTAPCRTN